MSRLCAFVKLQYLGFKVPVKRASHLRSSDQEGKVVGTNVVGSIIDLLLRENDARKAIIQVAQG